MKVVWDASTGTIIAASQVESPVCTVLAIICLVDLRTLLNQINFIQWDPYNMNEFVSAGVDAALLFWLIDETGVCRVSMTSLLLKHYSEGRSSAQCALCNCAR